MNKSLHSLSDDFVVRFARDLYHCSSCNYCVDAIWPERGMDDVCATMAHHTRALGYSGRGFIEAARAVLEGTPLNAANLAERVFTCTSCGNCESACPIGLRPASIGQALREELVEAGYVPAAIGAAQRALLDNANPYGAAQTERAAWAEDLPDLPDAGGPVYFVGCAAAIALPEEARAGYELLRHAGLVPLIATTDCCGAPLKTYGDPKGAETYAVARANTLNYPNRTMIVAGYECQHQLETALSASVISITSWLLEAVRDGVVKLERNADSTPPSVVHLLETCQLKRRTPDEPATEETAVRELFAKIGFECANKSYPSQHAPCCGAGGGMPVMQQDASEQMARARLPADGIAVTLDPRCAAHLRNANGERAVTVLGFAEFIARYCILTPAQPGASAP